MADKQDVRYTVTAEDRFSRTFAALKREIGSSQDTFGGLVGAAGRVNAAIGAIAFGGVAGAAGFTAAIRQAVNDLDALNDVADATGSTVESLSALEDVARRNGDGLELVAAAVMKMNKVLSEAQPGSPIAADLERIGVSVAELKRQDPSAAFQTLAIALQGFADDGSRARVVQELFGKSTKDVAHLLKDAAEAGTLNARATTEQAQQAEKLNKEFFALQTNANLFARALASAVVPSINEAIERFRVAAKEGKNFYEVIFEQQLKLLGVDVEGNRIKNLQTQLAGVNATLAKGVRDEGLRAELLARSVSLAKQLATAQAKTAPPELNSTAGGGRGSVNPDLVKPSIGDPPSKAKQQAQISEAQRYLETLDRQIEAEVKLTKEEEARLAIERKLLDGITPALEARIVGTARYIDKLKEVNAELEREAGFQKLLSDKSQRDVNEGLALLDATPSGQVDRINRQTDQVLQIARANPNDEAVQRRAREALAMLRKQMDDLNAPAEAAAKEFDKLQDTIEKSMDRATDAVLDFAIEGKGSFGSLFKAFERDMLRAVIEDPLRDTMKSAVALIRKELSSLGTNNPLEAVFGFLKGFGGSGGIEVSSGVFDFLSGFVGRANGGPVKAGDLVRWQENGREWFVPGSDGTVVNQSQRGGGQPAVTYAPVFNVNGDVSPQTVSMMKAVSDQALARFVRSMRTGGAYAT